MNLNWTNDNPMFNKNPVCFWINLKDEKQVTETLLWCPFCFHWLMKYGMLQSVAQRIDSSYCSDELNIYWCIIPHHNLDNRAVCVCVRVRRKKKVYHCKAHISFFESRSIVGTISSHCHHLSGFTHRAVNNTWWRTQIDHEFFERLHKWVSAF